MCKSNLIFKIQIKQVQSRFTSFEHLEKETRGLVSRGAAGAMAPTEIWQRVQRTSFLVLLRTENQRKKTLTRPLGTFIKFMSNHNMYCLFNKWSMLFKSSKLSLSLSWHFAK